MSVHSGPAKKFAAENGSVVENGAAPVAMIKNGSVVENERTDGIPYSDGELLEKVLQIVKREKLYGKVNETEKVVDFIHPGELTVRLFS